MEDEFNIYDDAYLYGEDESKDSVEPPHVPPPKPSTTTSAAAPVGSSPLTQVDEDVSNDVDDQSKDEDVVMDEQQPCTESEVEIMKEDIENIQVNEDEEVNDENVELMKSPKKEDIFEDDDVLEGYGESRLEDAKPTPPNEEPTPPAEEATLLPAVEQIYTDANSTAAIQIDELSWWTSDKDIIQIANLATRDSQCVKEVSFSEHKVNGKSRGSAWVLFTSVEAAARTKAQFESIEIDQRIPIVAYADPTTNPFRTLPKDSHTKRIIGTQQNVNPPRFQRPPTNPPAPAPPPPPPPPTSLPPPPPLAPSRPFANPMYRPTQQVPNQANGYRRYPSRAMEPPPTMGQPYRGPPRPTPAPRAATNAHGYYEESYSFGFPPQPSPGQPPLPPPPQNQPSNPPNYHPGYY